MQTLCPYYTDGEAAAERNISRNIWKCSAPDFVNAPPKLKLVF